MAQIVLIVDDDLTSLKLATGIIEKEYRVAAATGGAMALKYLEKNTPDLILLDLNMPDMDGLEVMEELKSNQEYAKIPVIFVTAEHSPQIEVQCLESGAADFVCKPFVPLVLISRIRRIIELFTYRRQLESIIENRNSQTENK